MSHGVACYSKGAELASSSAADAHLFWHFLSTLTQKTHDNATLCISEVRAVWRSPFTSPFLVPMITKITFCAELRGRKPWRSPVDVRRDGQKASHVVTVNNREKTGSCKGKHTKIWHRVIVGGNQRGLALYTELQSTNTSLKIPDSTTKRPGLFLSSFCFHHLFLTISFKVHDRATMHPSIYCFNQTESKDWVPRELQKKTNTISLLITALTRSRQSWRTYQGGEPVQVLDNCQLCQWLRLLFYCASLRFTAGVHLCPTLMIAFKSPLSAEDCMQTQRSPGWGFSMLTIVDYRWRHWRPPAVISAKWSSILKEARGTSNLNERPKTTWKNTYRLCNLSEKQVYISSFWQTTIY